MNTLLTKIRTAIYQATVVANARYRSDVLNLQAMGLRYSTLLSLVPFLAVMFSVMKAFDVENVLEPLLGPRPTSNGHHIIVLSEPQQKYRKAN